MARRGFLYTDDPDSHLPPKQTRFVEAMAECGNPLEAAKRAGYARPRSICYDLAKKPAIQKALRQRAETVLRASTPAMAQALVNIAMDESLKPADRIKAASVALTKAGLGDHSKVEHTHVHTLEHASDEEIGARLRALMATNQLAPALPAESPRLERVDITPPVTIDAEPADNPDLVAAEAELASIRQELADTHEPDPMASGEAYGKSDA